MHYVGAGGRRRRLWTDNNKGRPSAESGPVTAWGVWWFRGDWGDLGGPGGPTVVVQGGPRTREVRGSNVNTGTGEYID